MALVSANKMGGAVSVILLTMLLGMPVIGMFGSILFGIATLSCAVSRTDSWFNVLHAIAGFIGYWAVIGLIVSLPKVGEGIVVMFIGASIYSFFWIIWMKKTTKILWSE